RLLKGPVGLFKAISVLTVTGPIRDSKGTGPAPPKTSLGSAIRVPPAAKPPKLSFTMGWVKAPPPPTANCSERIFGKELSWADLNRALSEYPAVKLAPTAT